MTSMYIGQEYEIHINAYEFGILKKKEEQDVFILGNLSIEILLFA